MEEDLSKPVAKALLTVVSFDALVVFTVLKYRLQKEFLEEVSNIPKMFVPTFRRYYEDNKCMQSPTLWFCVFSFQVTVFA